MINKYIRLCLKYDLDFVTPLICEGLTYELRGFKPVEAYELVANRLCTLKNERIVRLWRQDYETLDTRMINYGYE